MRQDRLLWGWALILGGVVLLLENFGVWAALGLSFRHVFWPLLLITVGLWLLLFRREGGAVEPQQLVIPSDGARRAHVTIEHGGGQLRVGDRAAEGMLLSGTFGDGVTPTIEHQGDEARITLAPRTSIPVVWPWGGAGRQWDVALTTAMPLTLRVQAGGSEVRLNLANLQVTRLRVGAGASDVEVVLPAHTSVDATFEGGVASLVIRVPPEVAARIRLKGALYNAEIDEQRFPRQGDVYQSPDYGTATHRAEIALEVGMGSVRVI